MSDGGGYQVSGNDLQGHQNSVRRIAATLAQAADAAKQVSMGTEAYGLICGPLFVPIVSAVTAPGLTALDSAHESMNNVADQLGETAKGYADVEHTNGSSFEAINPDLR